MMKQGIIFTLLFLSVFPSLMSCQKVNIGSQDDFLISLYDKPANDGVNNALEKARLVAEVQWTPIKTIPSCYATPYPAGVSRRGLPYSLAQIVNGYVGLDVSFHTFVTAVSNPRSVMYTEDLSQSPYNGFDCAPYYGSVCSMSVWYALGIKATYFTSSIDQIPELRKEPLLGYNKIELCDVLWSQGHVAMVYRIERNPNGQIRRVSVFETTRVNQFDSKIVEYTFTDFIERWNRVGWVIYRPKDLSDNNAAIEDITTVNDFSNAFGFGYKMDLCTRCGDRVAYASGDSVVVNILTEGYDQIELYQDDVLYEVRRIDAPDIVFRNLPYGSYKARLVTDVLSSQYTYFEVIDIHVSYSLYGEKLQVSFRSANAEAEFMALCNNMDSPHYCYVLSDEQKKQGKLTVPLNNTHLKVFFRGKYGRVSNHKIKFK